MTARRIARGVAAAITVAWASGLAADTSSEPDWAEQFAGADIVILGEFHDNPDHHIRQSRIVDTLAPSALVFEMLTADRARRVTPELAADPEALAAALDWAATGWPAFEMYYPLIARAETTPIYGAEVPRAQMRAVFEIGAAAVFADVFGGDPGQFGLSTPLAQDEQAQREAGQQDAHCGALPAHMLPDFVAAQRLRDAALAQAAVEAFAMHGGPVVVITGNGHARHDWGVPAVLATAAPDLETGVLGQFEEAPVADLTQQFDVVALSAPMERPDPCAAFR